MYDVIHALESHRLPCTKFQTDKMTLWTICLFILITIINSFRHKSCLKDNLRPKADAVHMGKSERWAVFAYQLHTPEDEIFIRLFTSGGLLESLLNGTSLLFLCLP